MSYAAMSQRRKQETFHATRLPCRIIETRREWRRSATVLFCSSGGTGSGTPQRKSEPLALCVAVAGVL